MSPPVGSSQTVIHYHKIQSPPEGIRVLHKHIHMYSSSACAVILWKLLILAPPVVLSSGSSGSAMFLFTLLLCWILLLGISVLSLLSFSSFSLCCFWRGFTFWTVCDESLRLHGTEIITVKMVKFILMQNLLILSPG